MDQSSAMSAHMIQRCHPRTGRVTNPMARIVVMLSHLDEYD